MIQLIWINTVFKTGQVRVKNGREYGFNDDGRQGLTYFLLFTEEKVNVTRCPGQFECANGMACLNKTLICNGKSDCKDNSDETGCEKKSESKLTPLYFYILVGLAGVCFIFLLVIMILLCYRFCCQSKIAAAYERFK